MTNNRYPSHSVEGIFVFVFCLVLMIVVATNKIPSKKKKKRKDSVKDWIGRRERIDIKDDCPGFWLP